MLSRRMQCAGLFAMAMISFGGAMASEAAAPFVVQQNDRRDPFTFALNYPHSVPVKEVIVWDPPAAPFDLSIAREKLTNVSAQAENALLEGKSSEALYACDIGLGVLASVPPDRISTFGKEQTEIIRFREAATRIAQRANAERDFKMSGLSLSGVIAGKSQSSAIVNGKVVNRGELIPLLNDAEHVMVVDIQPGAVIFLFRGYRMQLILNTFVDK